MDTHRLSARLFAPLPAWRVALVAVVVAAVSGFAGWATGRMDVVAQTEEHVVVLQRTEFKTEQRVRRAVDTHVTSRPVLLQTPDGGVVVASETTTTTKLREDNEVKAAGLTDLRDERKTTTTSRPDWRVGALGGVRFSAGPTGVVAGGIVERRIAGAVSVAGWGLVEVDTSKPTVSVGGGQVGLGVLIEF